MARALNKRKQATYIRRFEGFSASRLAPTVGTHFPVGASLLAKVSEPKYPFTLECKKPRHKDRAFSCCRAI
jgi:hypothetical protein